MHYATMSLLIMIAVIGLSMVFTAPKNVGKRPPVIQVGSGVQTLIISGVIIVWLVFFGLAQHDHFVRVLSSVLIAERAVGMVRYAGLIAQPRKISTPLSMSVLIFWSLAEAGLATTLLVLAW